MATMHVTGRVVGRPGGKLGASSTLERAWLLYVDAGDVAVWVNASTFVPNWY
jgi:hypothetical protein